MKYQGGPAVSLTSWIITLEEDSMVWITPDVSTESGYEGRPYEWDGPGCEHPPGTAAATVSLDRAGRRIIGQVWIRGTGSQPWAAGWEARTPRGALIGSYPSVDEAIAALVAREQHAAGAGAAV
jgi:hypothetical protein